MGELHAHVTESAEADDADFLARAGAPVFQRGIERDARAQQRRDGREVELVRNVQDEFFVDDDALGIAAVGDGRGFVRVGRSCR